MFALRICIIYNRDIFILSWTVKRPKCCQVLLFRIPQTNQRELKHLWLPNLSQIVNQKLQSNKTRSTCSTKPAEVTLLWRILRFIRVSCILCQAYRTFPCSDVCAHLWMHFKELDFGIVSGVMLRPTLRRAEDISYSGLAYPTQADKLSFNGLWHIKVEFPRETTLNVKGAQLNPHLLHQHQGFFLTCAIK